MSLAVITLHPSGFAAAVEGLAVEGPLDAGTAGRLRSLFGDHPVLCVRTAGLDAGALYHLARALGEPKVQLLEEYRVGDVPEVSVISSEQFDTRGDGRRIVFGGHWHTDDSYLAVPARATMLYAHVIPSRGGDTLFADTVAAYEALDAATREEIDGLEVVHTYQSRRNVNAVPTRSAEVEARTPPVRHPLVLTDPEAGTRSLYLNPNRMDVVVGWDEARSDALLDRLIAHATAERFVYRHVWRAHDVVVWDNHRTMHKASADYGDERREMFRVLLKGAVPV